VSTIRGRLSRRQTEQQQEIRDREGAKVGVQLPSVPVTTDWRKLSKAARQEHEPKKFVFLLKQLYDVVNEGEKERGSKVDRRLAKAA
jgi:hypothetical protein